MKNPYHESYWTSRYLRADTGWDTGSVTTPIKQYLDQIADKSISILIPGTGNAYEAAYAMETGLKVLSILDFSLVPLMNFSKKYRFSVPIHSKRSEYIVPSNTVLPFKARKLLSNIIKESGIL